MVSDQRPDESTTDDDRRINLANAIGLAAELLVELHRHVSAETVAPILGAAGVDLRRPNVWQALLTNPSCQDPASRARGFCNSNLVDSSSSLHSSSSSTRIAPTKRVEGDLVKPKSRTPRVQKLDLDRPLLDARYAILRAVWLKIQPTIGRSTTWTSWRNRNAVVGMDLARGCFTPEHVVRAWELASNERGEPVRELSRVQSFIERVETAVAKHKATKKP